MPDEPSFPKPEPKAAPYRAPETGSSGPQKAAPIVVTRADAPPSEPPKGKLTREEMRALLATNEVNHRSKLARTRRRAVIFVPTMLVDLVVTLVVDSTAATIVSSVLGLALLVWTTLPLFQKSDWAEP